MDRFPYDSALFWIPLLPILSAVILGFAGSKSDKGLVTGLGIGSVAISFVLALVCATRVFGLGAGEPTSLSSPLYTWFSLQGERAALPIDIRFVLDGLSAIMAVMVTGIGLLIHVYSASYMHDDAGYSRFFAYLNLFMGSMLLLVLASSLPVLFVGWEGVGVCSYLLIGFWFKTPQYAAAAKKAFIVNRIGDLGLLLGMFLLAFSANSVDIQAINAAAPGMLMPVSATIDVPTVTAAALLLFVGCAGKSAQLPLYVWLPDAMAGPTPVSALIHAATMVTAGVYLCCRMSPLFAASTTAMAVIAIVGTSTALLAATIAVAQKDLKKVLAYSTVSQLGFMFGAIGVGAFSAGIFHVFTHAFFKACLFLGAGSVMHAVGAHGDVDITKLGGLGKKLRLTSITFVLATASIAGVPLFAGFFSKDAILAGAVAATRYGDSGTSLTHAAAWITLVGLALAAVLTAFYMTRAAALVFSGTYGGADAGYDAEPHESPTAMTTPLIVLAVGAVFTGWLGFGENSLWSRALGSSVRDVAHGAAEHAGNAGQAGGMTPHVLAMIIGTAAAAIGIGLGWVLFVGDRADKGQDAVEAKLPAPLFGFLRDAWRVDAFYDFTIGNVVRGASSFVAAVDRTFLEPAVVEVPALVVELASRALSRMQTGYVQTYGLAMAFGLVGALGWMQWPKLAIEIDTRVDGASFHLGGGLGQRVTVDLDSDGTPEAVDSTDTHFDVDYARGDLRGVAILATLPPNDIETVIRLTPEPVAIAEAELGAFWRVPLPSTAPAADQDAAANLPILVRAEHGVLHLRPNHSLLTVAGRQVADEEVELRPGDRFMIGRVSARVIGIARATFTTTNVFGERRTDRREIVLRPSARPRLHAPGAGSAAPAGAAPMHGPGGPGPGPGPGPSPGPRVAPDPNRPAMRPGTGPAPAPPGQGQGQGRRPGTGPAPAPTAPAPGTDGAEARP